MPLSRLGMVLQQAGFQSKRVDRLTGGHPFSKIYTPTRVCEIYKRGCPPSARPPIRHPSNFGPKPRYGRDVTATSRIGNR